MFTDISLGRPNIQIMELEQTKVAIVIQIKTFFVNCSISLSQSFQQISLSYFVKWSHKLWFFAANKSSTFEVYLLLAEASIIIKA